MESAPPSPQPERESYWLGWSGCGWACLAGVAFFFVFGCCFGPIGPGIKKARESACMQTAHAIGLALFSYANDNQGLYPDGTSSTEVFQKLMDGGYITYPTIFYVPMDGKSPASQNQKILKPENVCWDVTGGVSRGDPGGIPLVFLTGFRVTYAPGGGAVSLTDPYPPYQHISSGAGLAVYFVNNSAAWISGQAPTQIYGHGIFSMEHLLPTDLDTRGKTYRQLTPEGVLR